MISEISWKSTVKRSERRELTGVQCLHVNDVVVLPVLITLNRFHTVFWCFYWWIWTGIYPMGYGCQPIHMNVLFYNKIKFSNVLILIWSAKTRCFKLQYMVKAFIKWYLFEWTVGRYKILKHAIDSGSIFLISSSK